ncbi:hypothetical protein PHYSODRAFT_396105, partial [Phytophthora sojae]
TFLPLEELEPTLTDVLAFIDTFESDSTASTASSSDDGKLPPPPPVSSVERRKTRKAAASRRCQQKKRAELLALRAQVTALETRLQELQKIQNKNVGGKTILGRRLDKTQRLRVAQAWQNMAQLERELRLQSEQRHRQLLDVVTKQSRVARAVKNVLDNVTAVVHI